MTTAPAQIVPPSAGTAAGLLGTTQQLGGSPERKFKMKNGTKKHNEKALGAPELSGLLERLDVASRRLNSQAEEASRRIQALEQRLVEAEPGIAVWGATLLTEQATFQADDTKAPEAAERVVTLGFAKLKKDKWGIAVREVLKGKNGRLFADESTLLHKAERHLRLLAMPHLEALTRQVVEAVEGQTAAWADDSEEQADPEHATLTIGSAGGSS